MSALPSITDVGQRIPEGNPRLMALLLFFGAATMRPIISSPCADVWVARLLGDKPRGYRVGSKERLPQFCGSGLAGEAAAC